MRWYVKDGYSDGRSMDKNTGSWFEFEHVPIDFSNLCTYGKGKHREESCNFR